MGAWLCDSMRAVRRPGAAVVVRGPRNVLGHRKSHGSRVVHASFVLGVALVLLMTWTAAPALRLDRFGAGGRAARFVTEFVNGPAGPTMSLPVEEVASEIGPLDEIEDDDEPQEDSWAVASDLSLHKSAYVTSAASQCRAASGQNRPPFLTLGRLRC